MSEIIVSGQALPLAPDEYLASIWATLGKNTLRQYREAWRDFSRVCGLTAQQFFSLPHGEANRLAAEWRTSLLSRYSAKSAEAKLGALSGIIKRMRWMGVIDYALQVEPIKAEKLKDTKGPGLKVIACMLRACDLTAKGRRDACIVTLLYAMGLRRSELAGIDWPDHVDLTNNRIIIRGKGRNENEYVKMPDEARKSVMEWVNLRGLTAGPLFVNLDERHERKRLSTTGIYNVIRSLGKQCGVDTHPHALRHSAITDALDATNGNLRAVAAFSRHKNVNILSIYDDRRKDAAGSIADTLSAALGGSNAS